MKEQQQEPSEFPVDMKPVIRTGIFLFAIFGGLCLISYLQEGSEMYGWGTLLLAFVICFSAYNQRADKFRMVAILIGGGILCLLLFLFGGSDEQSTPENEAPRSYRGDLSEPVGLGEKE